MPYAVPPAKVRPGVVTAASRLLYLLAALQATALGAIFVQVPPLLRILGDERFTESDRDPVRTAIMVGIGVGVAISVAFIAGYILLGVFVGKGKQPARVVTWVVAGLSLLCNLCSFGRQAATTASSGAQNVDPELRQQVDGVAPHWFETLTAVRTVVELVALVAIVILLSLAASNEYFRKEDPVAWSPGTYYPSAAPATPVPAPESTQVRPEAPPSSQP
jgi:hypothetical protein